MKIVVVSPYWDPAGVGLNLNYAINNYTEHSCKGFARERTPLWNPKLMDNYTILQGEDEYGMLEAAVKEADVIHYNHMVDFSAYYWRLDNTNDRDKHFKPNELFPLTMQSESGKYKIDFEGLATKKRVVFHGHGGIWLLDPTYLISKCKELGIIMATCSPIDEVVVPGIKWVPNILPISRGIYNPMDRDFDGRLVCSLASNDPLYKGGALVEYIFEWLQHVHDGFDVTFRFVSKEDLCDGLLIRRAHHFTVDNWTQGFHGMAALEGLALGHVAFSRFDAMAKRKWDKEFDEPIPIVDVKGMDEFAGKLRLYNDDRDLLKEKSLASRKWMEDNYTEEQIVAKWIKLYGGTKSKKVTNPKTTKKRAVISDPVGWCMETHGLVPDDAWHTSVYDLTGVHVDEGNIEQKILSILGEPTLGTYIAGSIPSGVSLKDGFITIHEILMAVSGKWELHKFFRDVEHAWGKTSFFSLKPIERNRASKE